MNKTNTYSTILGGCWREKVVSDFGFGHSKSHFWAPENGHFWHFQVPKNGTLSARIKKRRPLFHANTPPKWWTRYLFHVFTSKSDFWPFYWFWTFWLRFQLFLHCKNPRNWNGQPTIVYGSINLKFFWGGPDTYTKLPCEERSPNPKFFFFGPG